MLPVDAEEGGLNDLDLDTDAREKILKIKAMLDKVQFWECPISAERRCHTRTLTTVETAYEVAGYKVKSLIKYVDKLKSQYAPAE